MKTQWYHRLYFIIYFILILAAFILPVFTLEGYTLSENTLSELGAQHTPYNWVINSIFISLSIATITAGYPGLKKFHFQLIFLLLFCISFFMTAICLQAPIDRTIPFDSFHNELHSIFSILTGITFCIFSISISFIAKKKQHKIMAVFICVVAIVLSYSMFIHSEWRGIYQRGIFILAFGWLQYSFLFYEYIPTKKSILKL